MLQGVRGGPGRRGKVGNKGDLVSSTIHHFSHFYLQCLETAYSIILEVRIQHRMISFINATSELKYILHRYFISLLPFLTYKMKIYFV